MGIAFKTVEAWSYFVTTNTYFFLKNFDIELAQMKLDELVEDVMNLDINKESIDDNRGHSQD